MNHREITRLNKRLTNYAKKGVFQDKKIYVYGGGGEIKEIRTCLAEFGLPVPTVLVRYMDWRFAGWRFMGMSGAVFEEALFPYNENVVVLILSKRYSLELIHWLNEIGYVQNQHFFVLNDVLSTKVNASIPSFCTMATRAVRGYHTYQKLTKGTGRTVFIAPYSGTGDLYLIGLFFCTYLEKNHITDYVFITINGACKKVAEMFNIQNVVVLNPTITDDIIRCSMFMQRGWPVVVLNDGWLAEPIRWLRGYRGLNFDQMFRYFVFGLDDTVKHCLPAPKECTAEKINALFEKYGLKKGKTVVLAPYANTLSEFYDDMWQPIIEHSINRGFTVCTNCASAREKPLEGTVPVFFPFALAIPFVEAAGCFIGVRSGMCDIISSAKCRKIIIYDKQQPFARSTAYEYFSLNRMSLCDDAIEILYTAEDEEICSKNICAMLELNQ